MRTFSHFLLTITTKRLADICFQSLACVLFLKSHIFPLEPERDTRGRTLGVICGRKFIQYADRSPFNTLATGEHVFGDYVSDLIRLTTSCHAEDLQIPKPN